MVGVKLIAEFGEIIYFQSTVIVKGFVDGRSPRVCEHCVPGNGSTRTANDNDTSNGVVSVPGIDDAATKNEK